MQTNGHFRRTFGFGRKQSYHIRCTFGFSVLQLVNSVVAESRVQSLSCGGRECARRRESLASLCTDWLCKDNRGSWLRYLRLHLVLWPVSHDRLALMTYDDLLFRLWLRPRHYRLTVSVLVFSRKSRFTFGGTYGFGRMRYVTFGLFSVSTGSKTSAFGRPLFCSSAVKSKNSRFICTLYSAQSITIVRLYFFQ